MKNTFVLILLLLSMYASSQSVFGYWYGSANVKSNTSSNNYLVELVLQPEKGYVKGVLNYYFKSSFRSIQVKGNYNVKTRQLSLYNIPVTYHGSLADFEVDCVMNLQGTLKVTRAGSDLAGSFQGLPDYKYTCPDINFNLNLNAGISKTDSVLKAIREYKETNQVWRPTYADTGVAVNIIPRKVTNYVVQNEFTQRQNVVTSELEVESDSLKVDFYDNGEVDGDSISVFYNKKLIANNQKLSTLSVHFDLVLEPGVSVNELTMFADNLGSIPPNTALMVIDDGKKQHYVRISSSLEKNATIKIKRKPNKP